MRVWIRWPLTDCSSWEVVFYEEKMSKTGWNTVVGVVPEGSIRISVVMPVVVAVDAVVLEQE